MNKVTIEGTEYNVVPASDGGCRHTSDQITMGCEFTNRTSVECYKYPCRSPSVIFLTDANFAKLITARLTE